MGGDSGGRRSFPFLRSTVLWSLIFGEFCRPVNGPKLWGFRTLRTRRRYMGCVVAYRGRDVQEEFLYLGSKIPGWNIPNEPQEFPFSQTCLDQIIIVILLLSHGVHAGKNGFRVRLPCRTFTGRLSPSEEASSKDVKDKLNNRSEEMVKASRKPINNQDTLTTPQDGTSYEYDGRSLCD